MSARIWRNYMAAFFMAAAIHFAVLCVWKHEFNRAPEFALVDEDSSLDVNLVTAAPADATVKDSEPETVPTSLQTQTPAISSEPGLPELIVVPIPTPGAPDSTPRPISTRRAKESESYSTTTLDPRKSRMKLSPVARCWPRAGGASQGRPGYLRNPRPAYPKEARQARQEGVVMLRVSVNSAGRVTAVRIEQSSGYPTLDQSAQTTVNDQWLFKPAISNGERVAAELSVPIRFSID
jgi:protein TonB